MNLPVNATHDDIKHRLADLFEETFNSWSRSHLPYNSDIPDIVLFDKATGIDFLIAEVKSGTSNNRKELEHKLGARKGENAYEQLKRYLKTAAITWGILADLSRLELYRYDERRDDLIHEKEVIIRGKDVNWVYEELMQMRSIILGTVVPPPIKITSPITYAEKIRDKAILLKEVILKLYYRLINQGINIREYELLKDILPAIITEEDFAAKTVAAILAKLTLTFNSGLTATVTSPELIREAARNGEIGYLSYFIWVQDYMATKYPQVFKSDIDLFNWWIPYSDKYESAVRNALKDIYTSLNLRLRTIIDYIMRYKPPKGKDVLGILYQFIRSEHEQVVLGAYYTQYELVKFVLDALRIFIEKASSKNYINFDVNDVYLNVQVKILDPACGSGSFLAGFIEKAIDYGVKKEFDRSEIASRLIHKVYGIDIDPLAVLTARTELFMLLSLHVPPPFHVNVYWSDSLKLAEVIKRSKAKTILDYLVPSSKRYINELKAPIRELDIEMKNAYNVLKNGVDVLIGNPPWGRRSEVKKKVREALASMKCSDPDKVAEEYMNKIISIDELRSEYFSKRDHNIFVPFIIQVSNMLKSGGILAILVDARFVASEWGKQFIDFLEKSSEYLRVLDVSRENLFIRATSYPALILSVKR